MPIDSDEQFLIDGLVKKEAKPQIGVVCTGAVCSRYEDLFQSEFVTRLPESADGVNVKRLDFNKVMGEIFSNKVTQKGDTNLKDNLHTNHKNSREQKQESYKLDTQKTSVKHNEHEFEDDGKLSYKQKGVGGKLKHLLQEEIDFDKVDGIVIPGDFYNLVGKDINESPNNNMLSQVVLEVAKEKGIPVLGVCGGMQKAAYYAGAMISDTKDITTEKHVGKDDYGYDDYIKHPIDIKPSSRLAGIYDKVKGEHKDKDLDGDKKRSIAVKSGHFQAVKPGSATDEVLAKKNLRVTATDKDGVPEAIEDLHGGSAPFLFTQFHPEFRESKFDMEIMDEFVKAAAVRSKKRQMLNQVKGADGIEVNQDIQSIEDKKKFLSESDRESMSSFEEEEYPDSAIIKKNKDKEMNWQEKVNPEKYASKSSEKEPEKKSETNLDDKAKSTDDGGFDLQKWMEEQMQQEGGGKVM